MVSKRGSGVLSLGNLTHEHLLAQDPIKSLEEQQAKWAADDTRPERDREPRKSCGYEFGDDPSEADKHHTALGSLVLPSDTSDRDLRPFGVPIGLLRGRRLRLGRLKLHVVTKLCGVRKNRSMSCHGNDLPFVCKD